jgi:uncharacterized protein
LKDAVVDTNVLVAVMVEDDANHKEALKLWENLGKAFVPVNALFELAYYIVKQNLDLELLATVVRDPKIEVVPNDLNDITFLVKHSERIKYYDDVNDQAMISVAERLDLELKTFDEDLKKSLKKK